MAGVFNDLHSPPATAYTGNEKFKACRESRLSSVTTPTSVKNGFLPSASLADVSAEARLRRAKAERQGFEPWIRLRRITVFETAPIGHSGISPIERQRKENYY